MSINIESATPTPISSEQELVNMGYTNLKMNARILARTGGDISKAAQILEKKAQCSKKDVPAPASPFDGAADTLVTMGFLNKKQNLRILAKTEGNLGKAIAILNKRSGANKENKSNVPANEPTTQVTEVAPNCAAAVEPNPVEEEKLKQLREAGFTDDEVNRKMLRNTGGSVEVVRDFLTAKAKLRETIQEAKNERKRKLQSEKERKKNLKHLAKVQKTAPIEKATAELETLSLSQEKASRIPQDCTRIFIDGSNLIYQMPALRNLAVQQREFVKASSVIEKMARKLTDISGLPTLLLFDESSRSVSEPKFELQSAAPAFTHSGNAILSKISRERSPLVVTADQLLGSQLLERGVTWIRPFQWLQEVAKAFEPLKTFENRKEVMTFLRQQIVACE